MGWCTNSPSFNRIGIALVWMIAIQNTKYKLSIAMSILHTTEMKYPGRRKEVSTRMNEQECIVRPRN